MTRLICTLLTLLTLVAPLASPLGAAGLPDVPPAPEIGARAFILMDYHTGRVLASKNENERVDPASITKLMTAYAVFRGLKEKQVGIDDPVTISEIAWRTGGSRSFIDVGSQVPLSVLIQGMIVQSGNDASVAVAEHLAGTEQAFAMVMNQYAKELGMKNTSYTNATGLPDPLHYTTAADIAILANALVREFPEYYKWYSQKEFTWNNITQSNRNGLLWKDPTVDGMKTGYTETAGYCLVSSSLRDGMRLISVVLGAESPRIRERDSLALLNYGFRFYETKLLYAAGKPIDEARVWKGEQDLVSVGVNQDIWVTLPRGSAERLNHQVTLPTQIIAPLDPATALGKVKITLADKPVAEAGLFPVQAVPLGSFWRQGVDSMLLWFE